MYDVFAVRPVSANVVDVDAVLATNVDHMEPESVDLSILYPVIADPPLFVGALHDRLICDDEAVSAERFVGGCGAFAVLPVE